LLEKNELTVDDVEVVNSSTHGPTMLPAKQADAFVTSYGPALLYQANGIGTIFETEEDDDLASLFVIAGRSEYIEKNPEAAEAIVKALERAYEFAQENPEKVYEDLATDSFPIEIQKQAYSDSSFESFNPVIDSVVEERAEDMISFLKSNNLITNDVDVSEILDTSVYEKALQK
jgi:sulfonate transport system substrate-binding protein